MQPFMVKESELASLTLVLYALFFSHANLWYSEHIQRSITPGPLHRLFPLPGTLPSPLIPLLFD